MNEVKVRDPFAVTDAEYNELLTQFNDLCFFQSWQLLRKNIKNNHTEDIEDIMQKLNMSIIRAGRYYKRQVYIEACLEKVEEYAKDEFISMVEELKDLWANKTRHGANKQKFGPQQESLLETIMDKCVPLELRPDKNAGLKLDKKFHTYCKAIAWNEQKSLGRKITRERGIRSGCVSLSSFSYLQSEL